MKPKSELHWVLCYDPGLDEVFQCQARLNNLRVVQANILEVQQSPFVRNGKHVRVLAPEVEVRRAAYELGIVV